MPIYYLKILVLLICGSQILCINSCSNDSPDNSDDEKLSGTQKCFCPDGTTSTQMAKTDGSGWEACGCTYYTIWCDPDTDFCWQDPQKDPDYEDQGVTSIDAVRYCEDFDIGGYDDWRLADIDELRGLIQGNTDTEPGGACPVTLGSAMTEAQNLSCLGGEEKKGLGLGGCYWNKELTGTCDKPDPAAQGHYLEYWATTPASDDPDHWIAYVSFDNAAVGFNHVHSFGDVRCLRKGPSPEVRCEEGDQTICTPGETGQCNCSDSQEGAQVCDSDGTCFGPCECTGFIPEDDFTDACPDCDKLVLTIKVPEKLDRAPHELMAFLYSAENYEFPPMRPPDGGNSENQLLNPDIDLNSPHVMTVPGCTYYRENCLEGDYYLFVALYMDKRWPPIPEDEDYWWGMNAEPIAFPFNESDHKKDVKEMEILLSPVSEAVCPDDKPFRCTDGSCETAESECCPEDKPYKCADGTCVATSEECGGDNCSPNDSEVLTCRYRSTFIVDNCADFPISAGWIEADVESHCKRQQGANAATVVVTQGQSCLVEKGALNGVNRCVTKTSGKTWYPYNTPAFVCTGFLSGKNESGPFCDEY
ncbi:MAG: DUF1566 domain-containing protein [Proteobacteria bacterium]|nr:DUF1566 domain-containing protein [Pseudomonadota bacterium]